MERRLRRLERSIPPAIPPETRAYAERMAIEDGSFTADELLEEVQSTLRIIGWPYTVERYIRHISRVDGILEQDLYDALERNRLEMERDE